MPEVVWRRSASEDRLFAENRLVSKCLALVQVGWILPLLASALTLHLPHLLALRPSPPNLHQQSVHTGTKSLKGVLAQRPVVEPC
jgi:hypothetical protein